MKEVIMVLVMGLLLTGVNLYAADGDFIIEGNVGIGTDTPSASLDVRGDTVFNEDGGDYDLRIEGDTNENLFLIDASKNAIGIGVVPSPYSLKYSLLNVATTANNNDLRTAASFYATQTGAFGSVGLAATGKINYYGLDGRGGATGISARAMAYQTGSLTAVHPGAGLRGMSSEVAYNFSSDKDSTIANAVGMANSHIVRGNWNGTETLTVTNMTGYSSTGFNDNYTPLAGDTININTMAHFRAYDSITNTGEGTINMTDQVGLFIGSMSAATNNYGIVLNGDGPGSDIVFGPSKETKLYGEAGNFIIDTSGKIGIGTSTPQSKLAVSGLSTSPPAGSTARGIVCITTDGDMWVDNNTADGICGL